MKNSRAEVFARRKRILEYLQQHSNVEITYLAKTLNISLATARRDVSELENAGSVERYFGGARLSEKAKSNLAAPTASLQQRSIPLLAEKLAIAKFAASLVKDGDTVFMNASSTALGIYPYIKKSMMIITNNGLALTTPRNSGTDLIILGGEVNLSFGRIAMVGELALNSLNRITSTKCILGVSGISVDGGITSMAIGDTPINRTMLSLCKGDKIVVADHTKIGIEHNFNSGKISDITHLITDTGANDEVLEKIRAAGITVITVNPIENIEEEISTLQKLKNNYIHNIKSFI